MGAGTEGGDEGGRQAGREFNVAGDDACGVPRSSAVLGSLGWAQSKGPSEGRTRPGHDKHLAEELH